MKKRIFCLWLATLALTAADVQAEGKNCETAFAYGDKELSSFLHNARWGWQITIENVSTLSRALYAGAGQNDLSKGKEVGGLEVRRESDKIWLTFNMADGFIRDETHLYVGSSDIPTSAPGQYAKYSIGDIEDIGGGAYQVAIPADLTDDVLYVVAHAEVCEGETEDGCAASVSWWKGAWEEDAFYTSGNVVQYDGSSYVNTCCPADVGVVPPLNLLPNGCWDIMAAQGVTGPVGPQGETGPMGPAGPQGVKGDKGDTGDTGPQGATGATGPQGVKGDTGDTGSQGIQGEIGPAGPQGDTGATGPMGPAGPQGDKGDKGDTGPQGPQGIQGEIGPAGPQGDTGATGPMGPAGPQGVKGDKGDTGDTGPQGPQGIQGEIGPKGDRGAQGPAGPVGPAGPQGVKGEQGPQGLVGERGATGPVGPQGPPGVCTCPSSVTTYSSFSIAEPTEADAIKLVPAQCYEGELMVGIDQDGQIICRDADGLCSTAFAYGATELEDILPAKLWGWQLSVSQGQTLTQPLYVAALNNDLSSAKLAGSLTVTYVADRVTVKFTMEQEFTMQETHLYIGTGNVTTALPSEYPLFHEGLKQAVVDSYEIKVSGDAASLNLAAQAVVCKKK